MRPPWTTLPAAVCLLTCDDQPAGGGGELGLPGESVLGAALVGLEAVLGGHVSDLELPAGQHHVLPIYNRAAVSDAAKLSGHLLRNAGILNSYFSFCR